MAERLAYSITETAEALGVSRDLVYDILRAGALKSVRVGRRRLVSAEALKAYLASSGNAA
jgi:excisionase family DNA binding protein